jgi:CO dehydrogenase nickel-insertion accessory protein CooC1
MARNLLQIQDVAPKVAVSGMGGAGKSTSARTPVGFHRARGPKVLAIDANPDVNLALPLGVPPQLCSIVRTIVEERELIEVRRAAKIRVFVQISKSDSDVAGVAMYYAQGS